MKIDRNLNWEGCHNTRDLGGLETEKGDVIRRGLFVRSDSPHNLTKSGWQSLKSYGIKTIVDLRNESERVEAIPAYEIGDALSFVFLPHDGLENKLFWGEWNSESWDEGARLGSTPLYYRKHLAAMPERTARVLIAIAEADSAGVLFHCIAGRDRTGIISMLLLMILDIVPEQIANDYCISRARRLKYGNELEKAGQIKVDNYLAEKGTDVYKIVLEESQNASHVERIMKAGLKPSHIEKLKARAFP